MKIEAVTVCVNYGDFLAHTLPVAKRMFDNMVVVTDMQDKQTKQLCDYHNVKCVRTDAFYEGDKAFCKGAGINAGLAQLSCADWVVHMDADIVLPPRTRELLHKIELEPDCVYGIDRVMCRDYEEWLSFMAEPEVQHDSQIFVKGNAFDFGVRVAKLDTDGYVPIGFFQLWNAGATGIVTYPTEHGTAARADMLHAMQWRRARRHLIPEIIGIHLESEDHGPGHHGRNWRGRTTRPFKPCDY